MRSSTYPDCGAETGQKRMARLLSVAFPAAGVTTGLFFAMQNLIKTDDFDAPALTVYDIEAYAEQKTEPPESPPPPRVINTDPISPPPRPPKLVASIETPDVPLGLYEGVVPADYGAANLDDIRPKGIGAIIDRSILPISPPLPTYPASAERQGLEGVCDVYLKVSPKGAPFDVDAQCSHPVFEKAAKRSVEKVKFAPQIRNGLPVTVTGVVYPLEFRLKR